ITQIIGQINDATVLEAYFEILKNLIKLQKTQVIGHDSAGNPLSGEELAVRVEQARKRIESGQSISDIDLRKDSENRK
ncbi:MAG: hypothetical protein AAFV25_25445, partial [Bacteroidota bacterium]